jgi:hypothetical protein
MKPKTSSLYSKGNLRLLGVSLRPLAMEKAAGLLKDDRYQTIDLANSDLGFEVEDGRVHLSETAMALAGAAAVLYGSSSLLDQALDFKIRTQIPIGRLRAAGLGASLNLDAPGIADGPVDLTILIGGTAQKPRVELRTGVVEDLQAAATALVEEQVGEVIDEALEKARAAGDALVAEARRAAEALAAEAEAAGEKLEKEADKAADKLMKEAKGNAVAEAAAKETGKKLRQEAREKAGKLEKEAKKKGDALVSKAEAEKQALISAAEQKAGR